MEKNSKSNAVMKLANLQNSKAYAGQVANRFLIWWPVRVGDHALGSRFKATDVLMKLQHRNSATTSLQIDRSSQSGVSARERVLSCSQLSLDVKVITICKIFTFYVLWHV